MKGHRWMDGSASEVERPWWYIVDAKAQGSLTGILS